MTVLARRKNGRSEKRALAQGLLSFHPTAPAQSHISRLTQQGIAAWGKRQS